VLTEKPRTATTDRGRSMPNEEAPARAGEHGEGSSVPRRPDE
jgi:hypothetical protein